MADTGARTPVTDRLERWRRESGVDFAIFEHAPVHTREEASRVRSSPLEEGAKALVVRADHRYVQVVPPAHLKADNAQLRVILGTRKLRFVTPEEPSALIGCAPGAVPPFGNLFGLPVLVDAELCRNERVAFNAGSNSVSISPCAARTSCGSPAPPCAGSRDPAPRKRIGAAKRP